MITGLQVVKTKKKGKHSVNYFILINLGCFLFFCFFTTIKNQQQI